MGNDRFEKKIQNYDNYIKFNHSKCKYMKCNYIKSN